LVGTEPGDELDIGSARRGGHPGAQGMCKLHRVVADPAGGNVDHDTAAISLLLITNPAKTTAGAEPMASALHAFPLAISGRTPAPVANPREIASLLAI